MKRNLAIAVFFASQVLFLQSCMMVNPVKRQPLSVNEYGKNHPWQDRTVLIQFTPVVPGKPLDETIWDNIQGPIWDVCESLQIGFTQDYQFTPIVIPGGATVATTVKGTRIVIPFGNAFVTMFKSAVNKTFSNPSLCLKEVCAKGRETEFDAVVIINVNEFKVFESPMNHINFLLKVTSQIRTGNNNPISKQSTYKLNAFKLGSIANTSYGFIAKMNEAVNQFTEEAVSDLISTVTPEKL